MSAKDNDDKKTDGEAGAAATPVDDAYFTLYSASGRRDLYVNVYRTPTNDKLWKHDAFLSLFGCPSYVRFTFHFWVECKLNRYIKGKTSNKVPVVLQLARKKWLT
jgi:hypothetical protein